MAAGLMQPRSPGRRLLTWLLSGCLVGLCLSSSAPAYTEEGDMRTTKGKPSDESPEVLLDNVVRIFDRVAKEMDEKYYQPRSAMTTHLVCMRAAGWREADYETLMTISGFGISFVYEHKDKFWVSYVPPPGADERITKATGFGWEWLRLRTADDAWRTLKRTIDDGKAVRAPHLEELVFAGYHEAAKKADRKAFVLCEPFARPGRWWSWQEFEQWFKIHSHGFMGRHTKKVRPVAAKTMALEVMRNIVEWAEHHPYADNRAFGAAEFGLAGLDAYADDVADTAKGSSYFHRGWLGCHNIYPQWTARKCTAVYLSRVAKEFPRPVADHIRAAARQYEAAYAAWQEWEEHLGRAGKAPKNAWSTKKHRLAGAAAIREAIDHERAAIAEVAEALRNVGAR
jgi:hypothetical protein